jgi:hypothetical protein
MSRQICPPKKMDGQKNLISTGTIFNYFKNQHFLPDPQGG